MTQALKRLNVDFEIADYVEIDKYAVASYNAINGTNFEPQDIKEWDKDIDVDLIMHGSPCQDISLAGQQAGADEGSGTRSSLMYETIRIVNKLKPKYVIWENVKNLISKKHKHNFDKYLQTLSEGGYTNYWQVLNAKDYGIPQNRERVFTISIRNDIDKGYEFPDKKILNNSLQELLEKNVDEKYFVSEKGKEYILKRVGGFVQLIDQNTTIAHCPITAKGNANWTGNFLKFEFPPKKPLTLRLKDMLEDEVDEKYYLSEKQIERIKTTNYNVGKTRIQEKNYCDTLCARDWKDPKCVKIRNANSKGYDEAIEGDSVDLTYPNSTTRRGRVGHQVSQTIPASDTKGVVVPQYNILRIRKLTPKECWRLMGFSDEAFNKASKVNSNTQLYKQARKLNSSKCASRNIKELNKAR